MQLRNESGFPATMLIGSVGEFEQLAIIVCKCTYVLDSRGGLTPVAPECAWPVFRAPMVVDGVRFGSELDYLKRGVDIIVFGEAVAPRRKSVTSMTVEVRCGRVRYGIDVIGDRRWRQAGQEFWISDPEPFVSMPLTNDRAFGGSPMVKERPLPHHANDAGRGFVCEEASVDGTLLPNLERPNQRIREWRDNPVPACLFKPSGLLFDVDGPCSQQSLGESPDPGEASRRMLPRMLNQTVPDLICPEGGLGQTLILSGFDADGRVTFPLPSERSQPGTWGPYVRTRVGDTRSRFPMDISTVVAFVPQRALVLTWRGLFRYLFVPEELRAAELVFCGDPYIEPPVGD